MRTLLWTVFLVVALNGMASASSAFAATTTAPSPAIHETSERPGSPARSEDVAVKAEPDLNAYTERRPVRPQPQVLSKNFQSPKPVQIYWFFGGR
jgi:hypothetical protein